MHNYFSLESLIRIELFQSFFYLQTFLITTLMKNYVKMNYFFVVLKIMGLEIRIFHKIGILLNFTIIHTHMLYILKTILTFFYININYIVHTPKLCSESLSKNTSYIITFTIKYQYIHHQNPTSKVHLTSPSDQIFFLYQLGTQIYLICYC